MKHTYINALNYQITPLYTNPVVIGNIEFSNVRTLKLIKEKVLNAKNAYRGSQMAQVIMREAQTISASKKIKLDPSIKLRSNFTLVAEAGFEPTTFGL